MGSPLVMKKIKNIISSLPYRFHSEVTMLDSMHKLGKLIVNKLVGDIQVFELNHLFLRKEKISSQKIKSLVFKMTKGSEMTKDVCTTCGGNDDSDLDEEEMAFVA